jgi:hypothetical protein
MGSFGQTSLTQKSPASVRFNKMDLFYHCPGKIMKLLSAALCAFKMSFMKMGRKWKYELLKHMHRIRTKVTPINFKYAQIIV